MQTRLQIVLGAALLLAASSAHAQRATLGPRLSHRGVSVLTSADTPAERGAFGWVQRSRGGDVTLSVTTPTRFDPPTRTATRSSVRVCGHEAQRIEVSFGGEDRGRVTIGAEHMVTPVRPAMTHVTVVFSHHGHRFVVAWAIETARRAAMRATEETFFGSVRCDGA